MKIEERAFQIEQEEQKNKVWDVLREHQLLRGIQTDVWVGLCHRVHMSGCERNYVSQFKQLAMQAQNVQG